MGDGKSRRWEHRGGWRRGEGDESRGGKRCRVGSDFPAGARGQIKKGRLEMRKEKCARMPACLASCSFPAAALTLFGAAKKV